MKFNETVIYRTLSIPGDEWEKSCVYIFTMKIPFMILLMLVGIPIAIIVDIWYAFFDIGKDA